MNPCNDHFQFMQQCHLVLIVQQETVLPPSDHDCFETLAPSGDHCFTETEAPSSDHYCIDIVMPSSDHCYTETVPPSSDHCCTKKMAPPSDHLHTKRTEQRKVTGEKTFTKSLGPWPPSPPLATPDRLTQMHYPGLAHISRRMWTEWLTTTKRVMRGFHASSLK